jgi:hypothetical protein
MAQLQQGPTLATILMVEKALKDMPNSVMTFPELKRSLPKQVNHNTLMEVIDYLDKSNKICVGTKGITWTLNTSPEMERAIAKATRVL